MPRGSPDGGVSSFLYASQTLDVATVYTFLWGFSPIDGQGRLIYLDTFNNGMEGWDQLQTGAADFPVIVSSGYKGRIYSPPNGVALNPKTTSGDVSWIGRTYFLGQAQRLGFEAGFDFSDATPNWFFRIDYNPLSFPAYAPVLQFDHASAYWQIQVNGGTFENIFGMNISAPNTRLIQIKIVGDFSTGKYVRALIGDNLIDLSAYEMPLSVSTIEGFVAYVAQARSYGAGCGTGVLGYVLITKDEP